MRLVWGAMAHHSHGPAFRQFLKEAEGEFLPMVLDGAIAAVNRAAFKQFLPVTAIKLAPGYLFIQHRAQQLLAGTKVGHPNVVARGRHATSTKASGQNP